MSIKMADASKGIRPADSADFQKGYDTFMHAATMLESKDVVHNPQLTAYWKKQQQDAYYGNLNLAAQSADATKFQADMWSSVAKDPTKFKDYDQLDQTTE